MDYCPFNNKPCSNPKNIQTTSENLESVHVCQQCAFHKASPFYSHDLFGLIKMIDEIIDNGEKKCETCGAQFSEINKIKRFGCEDCYRTFKKQSINIFSRCQTGLKHIGKTPKNWENKFLAENAEIQIALLNHELQDAIKQEKYEDAAVIQKKIKEIQTAKDNHEV